MSIEDRKMELEEASQFAEHLATRLRKLKNRISFGTRLYYQLRDTAQELDNFTKEATDALQKD